MRQAIAHAIDKETIVDRVLDGLGQPAETHSPSPDRAGSPRSAPTSLRLRPRRGEPDPRRRRLRGHRRRRRPRDAGRRATAELPLRGALGRRDRPADRRVRHRLAGRDRHRDHEEDVRRQPAHHVIGKGDYDMFVWGWTPFVDPDPMLSYFTCDQVSERPRGPDELLQRRELLRPRSTTSSTSSRRSSSTRTTRKDIVHQMLTLFQRRRLPRPLLRARPPGLPEGPLRRLGAPAGRDRAGALLQHLADLRAAEAGDRHVGGGGGSDDGGGGSGGHRSRSSRSAVARRSAPRRCCRRRAGGTRRRAGVSARFVRARCSGRWPRWRFVVVFNFFLFRVVETDPVGTLFRGRNLTREPARRAGRGVRARQARCRSSSSPTSSRRRRSTSAARTPSNQPVASEIARKAWPTVALVGISARAVRGVRHAPRDRRGVAKADEGRLLDHAFTMVHLLDAGLLARDDPADRASRSASGWFPIGGIVDPASDATGLAKLADQAHHMFLPGAHADARLPRRVRDRHALVGAGDDARGLPGAGPRQGPARRTRAQPPRGAERAAPDRHAGGDQLRLRALAAPSPSRRSSPGPASGLATFDALKGPDLPMLQGLFLVFSASVILFNLLADLLYAYLDPRVRTS